MAGIALADGPLEEAERSLLESIGQALDLGEWRLGNDLDKEYQRIECEVRDAEKLETAQVRIGSPSK